MRARDAAALIGVSVHTLRKIPATKLRAHPMRAYCKQRNSPHLYWLEDIARYLVDEMGVTPDLAVDGKWAEWVEAQLRGLVEEPSRWTASTYPHATWAMVRDAVLFINAMPSRCCALPWPMLDTYGRVVLAWDDGDQQVRCVFPGTGHYMFAMSRDEHVRQAYRAGNEWPADLLAFVLQAEPDTRTAARRQLNL